MVARKHDVEQAAVFECLREVCGILKYNTAKKSADWVCKKDQTIPHEKVLAFMNNQNISEDIRKKIFIVALELISEHRDVVIPSYKKNNRAETAEYINKIILKHLDKKQVIHQEKDEDLISDVSIAKRNFDNWRKFSWRTINGRHVLKPGIYQSFRRYKPIDWSDNFFKNEAYDLGNPQNHALIIEVFFIDSLESILVTSELKVYRGTTFINHERILSIIYQRNSAIENGLNHRFAMLGLSQKVRAFYSGICMKVGDTTQQPLSSECICLPVPEKENSELYEAFDKLRFERVWTKQVEDSSIFSDYISGNPPDNSYALNEPNWKRVKIVKDFPFFLPLVARRDEMPPLFREPSRTLDMKDISNHNRRLSVFRHSQNSDKDKL